MSDCDVTMAVFGDCATVLAAEPYKHTRVIGLNNWLSIVSPATDSFLRLTADKIAETTLSGYGKRVCHLDANKTVLNYLLGEKADYLILDGNDCRKSIIFLENQIDGERACITDNSFMPAFKNCLEVMFGLQGEYKCVPSTQIDKLEYERAVEKVCSEILKVYQPQQIILNKHYFAKSYIDDRGEHMFDTLHVGLNNDSLELIKYINSLLEKN